MFLDRTVKSFCNLHYCKWTTSRLSVRACIAEKLGSKTVERVFLRRIEAQTLFQRLCQTPLLRVLHL